MSKVVVMYENGAVWSCDVDAVGDGDAGCICAAAGTVALGPRGLTYEPQVMPWDTGEWRSPMGVTAEWTNSSPGMRRRNGETVDVRGYVNSERGMVKQSYSFTSYTLRTWAQLEGAVSVTVDGVLTYADEDGVLVSAVGHDAYAAGDGGISSDFTTANHPVMSDAVREVSGGIRFEPELM